MRSRIMYDICLADFLVHVILGLGQGREAFTHLFSRRKPIMLIAMLNLVLAALFPIPWSPACDCSQQAANI